MVTITVPGQTVALADLNSFIIVTSGLVAALIVGQVPGLRTGFLGFLLDLLIGIVGAFLGKLVVVFAEIPVGYGLVSQLLTALVGALALTALARALAISRDRPNLGREFLNEYRKAEDQKVDYATKIQEASGHDIFKYLLLIDVAALESYTTQTRLQAEQSFRLSRLGSIFGFGLLVAAIVLGLISQLSGGALTVAYLAAVSGFLSEFVSGVFFYLYSATLRQINRFHSELQWSRRTAVGLLLSTSVQDATVRDAANIELAALLMSRDGDTHFRNAERDARTQKPESDPVAPENP